MAWSLIIIISILVPLAVVTIAVWGGRKRRASWADDRDLAPSPDVAALVADYLARRKRLRWASALVALVAVNLLAWMVTAEARVRLDLLPLMGTYVLGTVLAELTLTRPRGAQPAASLSVRAVDQYLAPGWTWALRSTAAAAALGWLSVVVLVDEPDRSVAVPSPQWAIVGAVLALGAALAAETVVRAIVRRPQPAANPAVLAADDAIRSDSSHAITGAALGFAVMWVGGPLMVWTDAVPLGLVTTLAGLYAWLRCARSIQQVRRDALGGGMSPAFGS